MKDRGFLTKQSRHLGKKTAVILVIALFAFAALGYLGTTAWYFIQIKQGKKINLSNPGSFTAATGGNSLTSFDRNFLEGGDHPYLFGKKVGANITIVEFLDYNCPNCRLDYKDMNSVATYHGNDTKVNVIVRHFPMISISGHEDSEYLARVAYCSSKQGRFQQFNDYFFQNYDSLPHPVTEDNLSDVLAGTNLLLPELKTCLNDAATKAAVDKDYFDGVEAGVRGTPTFFVNGQKIEGAVTFDSWKNYFNTVNP